MALSASEIALHEAYLWRWVSAPGAGKMPALPCPGWRYHYRRGDPPSCPVPTSQSSCTSLRGVTYDGSRPDLCLVKGSKQPHPGPGLTERRGNLRDPSRTKLVPRPLSTPSSDPVNEHPGSRRLPRRAAPLRNTGGGYQKNAHGPYHTVKISKRPSWIRSGQSRFAAGGGPRSGCWGLAMTHVSMASRGFSEWRARAQAAGC